MSPCRPWSPPPSWRLSSHNTQAWTSGARQLDRRDRRDVKAAVKRLVLYLVGQRKYIGPSRFRPGKKFLETLPESRGIGEFAEADLVFLTKGLPHSLRHLPGVNQLVSIQRILQLFILAQTAPVSQRPVLTGMRAHASVRSRNSAALCSRGRPLPRAAGSPCANIPSPGIR